MLVEEIAETEIDEAFWWFQRWVSGSLRDPDWEEDWLEKVHDVDTAFEIISNVVGNHLSVGRPLWRFLSISKRAITALERTKMLRPHRTTIQSFTTSRKKAIMVAEDLADRLPSEPVIVSAKVPAHLVLFGMKDVMKSASSEAQQALLGLEDWSHQDEVFVKVAEPLPLLTVERFDMTGRVVTRNRVTKKIF